MKIIFKIIWMLLVLSALAVSGCISSMDPDGESDMPWNTPQQWEGSRSIPGMSPGGY